MIHQYRGWGNKLGPRLIEAIQEEFGPENPPWLTEENIRTGKVFEHVSRTFVENVILRDIWLHIFKAKDESQ